MIYLLDSNVWIALNRGKSAVLAAKYAAMAPWADIRVCSVVVAELWFGCAKSAKPVANRASVARIDFAVPKHAI